MPAKTQLVLDRIRFQLNDAGKRYTLPDISRALNEAALILSETPRATRAEVVLTLAAGSRQDVRTIDAGKSYVGLHRIVCNVDSAGVPTTSVRGPLPIEALDSTWRQWRTAAPASAVDEYFLDPAYPWVFDVFPPAAAGVKVLAHASLRPAAFCVLNAGGTALANAAELVPVNDGFDVALGDYALFRLFSGDHGDPNSDARAQKHLQLANLAAGMSNKGPSA